MTTTFLKDDTIFRSDVQYRVIRAVGDQIQLENTLTGELSLFDPDSLLREYTQGTLYTAPRKGHKPPASNANRPVDFGMLTESARVETRRRIDYIVKLNAQQAFNKSKAELKVAIADIAKFRGESRAPHHTTIYRWRKTYIKAHEDVRALFSRLEQRGGRNQSRLDPAVEAMIDDQIERVFLSNRRGSAEDVYDAVLREIQIANASRAVDALLSNPSLRTIQRRITKLYAFEIAEARMGLKEALRRFKVRLSSRKVSRILELVEIDHTPVDLLVVNEKRVVIGRPTITVVLDRYSRCLLGFHLSLAGHGTPAVFAALRHALLPKTYIASRYPELNLSWSCFGWFEKLLMDNGQEFHAGAVADALLNLGIVSEFAESREPNDKPFVERFLRTLNYSFIHKLPGTTLDKVHKRVGFKSEDDACIRLEELDKLIHAWLNVYHNRPHAGLRGRTPLQVWTESASAYPPRLKGNADDVDVEFSEVADSALQHYGIDLNTFRYASERLSALRALLPQKSSVKVKWPRQNVGHVWVWDRFQNEYFKANNTDPTYNGLTLAQAKAVNKKKQEDPTLQRTRADAKEIYRQIVKEAEESTKLMERRKGARIGNKTSEPLHRESESTQSEAPPETPSGPEDESKVAEIEMDFSRANGDTRHED